MSILKIKAGRVTSVTADEFIGVHGTIFYNELLGDLRLSDGFTLGGIPLSVGSSGSATTVISNTAPLTSASGALWWNPTTSELSIRYENSWKPATSVSSSNISIDCGTPNSVYGGLTVFDFGGING
jgi:hypothetical protein